MIAEYWYCVFLVFFFFSESSVLDFLYQGSDPWPPPPPPPPPVLIRGCLTYVVFSTIVGCGGGDSFCGAIWSSGWIWSRMWPPDPFPCPPIPVLIRGFLVLFAVIFLAVVYLIAWVVPFRKVVGLHQASDPLAPTPALPPQFWSGGALPVMLAVLVLAVVIAWVVPFKAMFGLHQASDPLAPPLPPPIPLSDQGVPYLCCFQYHCWLRWWLEWCHLEEWLDWIGSGKWPPGLSPFPLPSSDQGVPYLWCLRYYCLLWW